ncbi:unnamed protein product, partial [marine sediment metagenome]
MRQEATSPKSRISAPSALVVCVYVLAAFAAAGGVFLGIWWALVPPDRQPVGLRLGGLAIMMGGFVVAALLWAAGWLVRGRHESLLTQRKMLHLLGQLEDRTADASVGGGPASAGPTEAPGPATETVLRQILEQLTELNTNSLLSGDERRTKRLRKRSELAEQLSRQIIAATRAGEFDDAERMLERLTEEIPDDAHLEDLRRRIEQGRQGAVRELVQGRMRRAADLMAVARFDEAIAVAEELHREHPENPETDGLLERVKREAQTFEYEQRRRLYSQINAHGEGRHWKQALEVAHRLIDAYPDSTEAAQVRSLLPTLVDNARIEEVRQLRDQGRIQA